MVTHKQQTRQAIFCISSTMRDHEFPNEHNTQGAHSLVNYICSSIATIPITNIARPPTNFNQQCFRGSCPKLVQSAATVEETCVGSGQPC